MRCLRIAYLVGIALLFVVSGALVATAIHMAETHRPASLVWMMSLDVLTTVTFAATLYWLNFLRRGSTFGPPRPSKTA